MKKLFISLIFLSLVGCSALDLNLPEFGPSEKTARVQIEMFQDLLNQGWEIYVSDGKAVLIKKNGSEILVSDIFNVNTGDIL